ncbi:hypothetical protein ES702_04934 [subsurface metagenome]
MVIYKRFKKKSTAKAFAAKHKGTRVYDKPLQGKSRYLVRKPIPLAVRRSVEFPRR